MPVMVPRGRRARWLSTAARAERPWWPVIGYAALVLAAQAAALRLIEAGPVVRYQHYRLDRLGTPDALWATGILLVQLIVAVVAGRAVWAGVWRWVADRLHGWRVAAVGAAVVGTSATLSRQVSLYGAELVFATCLELLNLATVILLVRSLRARAADGLARWLDRVLGAPRAAAAAGPEPGGLDRFAVVVALWVVVVAVALNVLAYQRHPHVPDEVTYVYHARYFARGLLTMPAPPVPAAFELDLMTYEPHRWYAPVPPGWALALAVGVLARMPWLVNPVLGGLNILLVYVVLRELYSRRTARLATALVAVSPEYLFLAMSFMNHTFALTCMLAAALSVAWLRRTGHIRWAWVGGLAIGVVSWIRPLEGVLLAALMGLWALAARGRRFRFEPAVILAVATALTAAVALPYNAALTGRPLYFPIDAYADKLYGVGSNDMGFGANRGLGIFGGNHPLPGHGLLDVLINANFNSFALNIELFGWSVGSLVVLVLFVCAGRKRPIDWQMMLVIATVVAGLSLYWFSGGPDFGARYWFLSFVPCVVLTARGIEWLEAELGAGTSTRAQQGGSDRPAGEGGGGERTVMTAVLALTVSALVTFVPWRAADKYYHYRGMRPDIRSLDARYHFGRSLVLVHGRRYPDYASAAIYNPIDLQAAAPVYAWDRSPAVRAQVLAAYPDRPVWLVDGPTVSHQGYTVVAGPIDSRQAARIPWVTGAR